jgi:pyruvate oxidase
VPVDPAKFDADTINKYKAEYNVFGQPALSEIVADLEK